MRRRAFDRFCGSVGEVRHVVLSDHVDADFGQKYGLLIKGMRLLARSIHVVDRSGVIAHAEIVSELTEHPDYDAALEAARLAAAQ